MSDLQDKYGKSNLRSAINAAIRSELSGGEETLDALAHAHSVLTSLSQGRRQADPCVRRLRDLAEIQHDRLTTIKAQMVAEIQQRYGL